MRKEIKTAFVPKTVEAFKYDLNDVILLKRYDGAVVLAGKDYSDLLTAYTEQQAELEKAKQTISDLHVGVKEIREKLEVTEQELEKARELLRELAVHFEAEWFTYKLNDDHFKMEKIQSFLKAK